MLERQILSHEDDASQQGLTEKQRKVLHIIFTQVQSHERVHTFDLGATRRTHQFKPNETYLNTQGVANLVGVSVVTVRNIIKRLRDLNIVSFTNHDRWSSVEILTLSSRKGVSTELSTELSTETIVKSGLKVVSVGHLSTEPDEPFLKLNKDKQVQVQVSSGSVDKDQATMFDKSSLPEERGKKKRRSTGSLKASDLKKNPAHQGKHIDALIRLNNLLSELPSGVMGSRPRRDQIARKVFAKWVEVSGRGERKRLQEFLIKPEDQDELMQHIKDAKMCHGEKWFTFEWLLSFPKDKKHFRENVHDESNLEKLFDSRYADVPDWLMKKRQQKEEQKIGTPVGDAFFDQEAYRERVRREQQATENRKDNDSERSDSHSG